LAQANPLPQDNIAFLFSILRGHGKLKAMIAGLLSVDLGRRWVAAYRAED
jgi:hypothetical protein